MPMDGSAHCSFPLLLGIVDHRGRDRDHAQYRLRWTSAGTRAVAKVATAADVAELLPIIDDPPPPPAPLPAGSTAFMTLRLLLLGPISTDESLELYSETPGKKPQLATVHQVCGARRSACVRGA